MLGNYLTVASLIAGFGVTVLMFRIQRELRVRDERSKEPGGLAWADFLVLAAILLSLVGVVLTLLLFGDAALKYAGAFCAAAVILLAAYPIAILDHYRLLTSEKRKGSGKQGEPIERIVVLAAAALAVLVFLLGVTRG